MGKHKCDNCGFSAKNKKGLANHKRKCNGNQIESKLFICKFCKRWFRKDRIKQHEISCEKYIFFKKYGQFLNFIFKLIISYNKQNFKNKFARFISEKKYIILNEKLSKCNNDEEKILIEKEFKEKNYIRNNQKILDNYYEKQKKEIDNEIKSYNLNENDNDYKMIFDLLQTIKMKENINLSFREILLDFYVNKKKEKKEYPSKTIINTIANKYEKNDFFTRFEMKKIFDKDLFAKICDLQNTLSEYDEKYYYYYNLLNEYFDGNTNKYLCVFCNKFYLYKWQHYKKCKKLKNEYDHSVYLTFMKFVNNNFKKNILNKLVLSEIYKNYINKDLYYFLNNIRENIESPYIFEENKHNFVYEINQIKISNIILEDYLNKLFFKIKKDFEVVLNPKQQRYLREICIQNYLKNGNFKTQEIIKEFKIQYNLNIDIEKNIKENENIINKLINNNEEINEINEDEIDKNELDNYEININEEDEYDDDDEIEENNKILISRSNTENYENEESNEEDDKINEDDESNKEDNKINEELNKKISINLKKIINDAYNKSKKNKKIKYITKY